MLRVIQISMALPDHSYGSQSRAIPVDFHQCPIVIQFGFVTIPHGGGRVLTGSRNVLINNLPAARQGDLINEIGAINSTNSTNTISTDEV